jgi:MFS family permease
MFMAFLVEGLGIYALLLFAANPFWFVILSGLVFFAWGEIFSLFPATCTDLYVKKFATANYGMLYTAKGTAALLVPLANVLKSSTGSWQAVFYVAAILNIVGRDHGVSCLAAAAAPTNGRALRLATLKRHGRREKSFTHANDLINGLRSTIFTYLNQTKTLPAFTRLGH